MEFLLDTANLAEIKKYVAIAPIAGVTSNPTIVKKEGQIDFFNHMKAIRDIIGLDKRLFPSDPTTSIDEKGYLMEGKKGFWKIGNKARKGVKLVEITN